MTITQEEWTSLGLRPSRHYIWVNRSSDSEITLTQHHTVWYLDLETGQSSRLTQLLGIFEVNDKDAANLALITLRMLIA